MKLSKISIGTPLNEKIVLYWEKSKHLEDGTLYMEDGVLSHFLFDGECLNDEPSHWTYMPSIEE